jgi:hypothetical protein
MKDTHAQQKKTDSTNLRDTVISRIETDAVKPKSKLVFLCADCFVWVLWVLVVMIGAIAFSETMYVSMHSGIELYEVTHENLFVFVIESLPYIWIVTFIGMALLAYFNMRKTKRGYTYPMWQIIISSVAFTAIGGFVLHLAGVSQIIDRMVGASFAPYDSVHERQAYLWAHPQDGRITGVFVERLDTDMKVRFRDSVEREWAVATYELPPQDIALLVSGKKVRLLGEADIDANPHFFYICGVLPWIPEEGYTVSSLREHRLDARNHMRTFEGLDTKEGKSPSSLRCKEIMKKLLRTQGNIE